MWRQLNKQTKFDSNGRITLSTLLAGNCQTILNSHQHTKFSSQILTTNRINFPRSTQLHHWAIPRPHLPPLADAILRFIIEYMHSVHTLSVYRKRVPRWFARGLMASRMHIHDLQWISNLQTIDQQKIMLSHITLRRIDCKIRIQFKYNFNFFSFQIITRVDGGKV